MQMKVIIPITVVVTVSVVVWGIVPLLQADLLAPVVGPKVELVNAQFTDGPCQTNYVLWVIPWGQYHTVTANLTLRNDGFTDGQATVGFATDGAGSGQSDFLVVRGQTVQVAGQFRVNDCGTHQYSAQIDSVKQA